MRELYCTDQRQNVMVETIAALPQCRAFPEESTRQTKSPYRPSINGGWVDRGETDEYQPDKHRNVKMTQWRGDPLSHR